MVAAETVARLGGHVLDLRRHLALPVEQRRVLPVVVRKPVDVCRHVGRDARAVEREAVARALASQLDRPLWWIVAVRRARVEAVAEHPARVMGDEGVLATPTLAV